MTVRKKGIAKRVGAVIEKRHCRTAKDFLDAIQPGLIHWLDGNFIFRGHGHDWPLIPSSHRLERWTDYRNKFPRLRVEPRRGATTGSYVLDAAAEETLLRMFLGSIENSGLRVPQHNALFETLDGRPAGDGVYRDELFPLIALAQHHQIPTRLLDWSRAPRIAAYFAATGALDKAEDGPMVVWALRTDLIDQRLRASASLVAPYKEEDSYLEIVTAPRESNPNLHAQAGLFTLLHQADRIQTLDEYIEEAAHNSAIPPDVRPIMYKFTAPKSEAQRVLMRLSHDGITAASVFPGYDGAARDVKERARLRKN